MSKTRLIMGFHCVEEILKSSPERVLKIYTAKELDAVLQRILPEKIPVRRISKEALSKMLNSTSHQLIAAEVIEKKELSLKELLHDVEDEERTLLLMLDSIFDPQNLGALIRAAECFGVRGVIWSKNRGAGLTPVVGKASSGALELMEIVQVSNLAMAIKECQNEGFTAVAADLKDAVSIHAFTYPDKTILVLGSEGKGVQPLISKTCDHRVMIPMKGKVASLNVSQAASVFLSKW